MNKLEQELSDRLSRIGPPDEQAVSRAAAYLDTLTKPPGSLGKLETLACRLAGITGELRPDLSRRAVVVMAGDHGVCAEGVSAFPQEVTPQMVMNFLAGGAAINVLARQAGAEVVCVDVGVAAELSHPRLVAAKVRPGTGNLAKEAAMTREEALQAVKAGIDVVDRLYGDGVRLFATGEMGIGNTTPSAAMLVALTGIGVEAAVGRGTGVDDAGLARKRDVVRRALDLHRPDASDPLGVVAAVGGLEIAGLMGVVLGAASRRCPVVIDGFISTVAALAAVRLCPQAASCLIASHRSQEHGHAAALEALGLSPMLELEMRLGEGTGAALAMHLIDAACRIMSEMATFAQAGVSKG
ncbi:nicotinate-nucleotide--dimethylbenzimidazole phosphoribosyltransferase [Paenibacillus thermoaerophilus]|uniref:Nicotinate-nucleotide--dimethylbenzimidazole phosphoribosyltransferase n=1 Tax=Paenibacillus thermoaerophilus TaxID=1215385 RepID=A0ABW2UYB8_9BACL|nr:nicotinate-nucleotide--dimethylbenzimidazole phosphoribosyltransferase [Paenibacillus thermoaerophilus]TMV17776.1 nicotinate-nucleotide--dimethylbenzimidazole phosphoribosyltransferase [Paenibacillus thermoaerophilus]